MLWNAIFLPTLVSVKFVTSDASCSCSSDITNDYESITIANLNDVDYNGGGIYVYSFNGEWKPVEGDCKNNYTYILLQSSVSHNRRSI